MNCCSPYLDIHVSAAIHQYLFVCYPGTCHLVPDTMVSWKSLISPAPSLDVPGLETVDLADKAMEKRIVRKQDLRILPWICVTYLLSTFPAAVTDCLAITAMSTY
jgi:hypothetical protein